MNRPAFFKRMFFFQNWAWSTATTAGFSRYYAPTFANLTNVAEYQVLFDLFKIHGIKITFRPRFDQAEMGQFGVPAGLPAAKPYLTIVKDPTSTQIPNPTGTYTSTNYNSLLEDSNGRHRVYDGTKPVSVYFKPMIQQADLFSGAARTWQRSPWLDVENGSNIAHRGFAVFLHGNNFGSELTGWSYDVFFTFYFSCKGAR